MAWQANSSELERSGWGQDLFGAMGPAKGLDVRHKGKSGSRCYNALFLSLPPSLGCKIDHSLDYITSTVMAPKYFYGMN